MSYKVYARHGGAVAAAMDDITARVPALSGAGASAVPIIQMGMSAQNGGASQGTFIVPDPIGNMDASLYFPPHTLIRWTEDASGDELWLAQGRISNWEVGRGESKAAAHVQWNITVDDANVDLRGLVFTADWVRPVETDTARLYALQAYTLNGTSSTRPTSGGVITYRPSTTITISDSHLAPDSDTTSMPAKTYPAGTEPMDVANDIATTAGKIYGVVIHHTGGTSHLCLLYVKEDDHATYASAAKISDVLADWDPSDLTAPVFEPIYDQGFAQRVDGNANVSGLVSRYGPDDNVLAVLNATSGNNNEYWNDIYQDAESVDATQAAARAAAIVAYRSPYQETDSVSILVLPEQHHLICAGMSLQIKAAPVNTANTSTIGSYLDRRIVSLQWEPVADGRYRGILQLNRPQRAPGGGSLQPASTSPKVGNWSPQDPCVVGATSDEFTDSGDWDGYVSPLGPTWVETEGTGAEILFPGFAFLPAMPPDPVAPLDHIMELDFGIGQAFPLDFTVLSSFVAPPDDVITQRLDYIFSVSDDAEVLGFHFDYGGLQADDTVLDLHALVRWGPGAFELNEETETVPGVWTQGRRIYTRVLAEAQRLRVKAWWEGDDQPDDWLIDIDFTISGESLDDWRFLRARTITPIIQLGGDVRLHSICIGDGLVGSTECGTCLPRDGDFVAVIPLTYGDATRTTFAVIGGAYEPGSLSAWVDGLGQHVTETDPSIGSFTLDFAPNADELVQASWRVA